MLQSGIIPIRRYPASHKVASKRTASSAFSWTEDINEYDGESGLVRTIGARLLSGENPPSVGHEEAFPGMSSFSGGQGSICSSEQTEIGKNGENTSQPGASRDIAISGQWAEALHIMQEFDRTPTTTRRYRRNYSPAPTRHPEGYIDNDLREACRLAILNAGVLEAMQRRSFSHGCRTSLIAVSEASEEDKDNSPQEM